MFLKRWLTSLRQKWVEETWKERCLLSEQHETIAKQIAECWRRKEEDSRYAQKLEAKAAKLRQEQYALGRVLGISDVSVTIVARRDKDGNFPPCPWWVMEQHVRS